MNANTVDPKVIIANIYYIAKKKGVRIGELEVSAGVSAGYLSRLNREDNTTIPSVEALCGIAKRLEVTVDYLVTADLGDLSKGEQYILSFLEKIAQDTIGEYLEWEKETPKMLREIPVRYEQPDHPLFESRVEGIDPVSGYPIETICYNSTFVENGEMIINGDSFHAILPYADAALYIMNVTRQEKLVDKHYFELEVYLIQNGAQPICATYGYRKEIQESLRKVYEVIRDKFDHKGLKKEVKKVLDQYMKGAYVFDDDIPF